MVSRIDKPGSPAGNARSTFQANLFGRDAAMRKALREKVLNVTMDDLQRVTERYLDPANEHLAVVSSETKASESKLDAQRIAL